MHEAFSTTPDGSGVLKLSDLSRPVGTAATAGGAPLGVIADTPVMNHVNQRDAATSSSEAFAAPPTRQVRKGSDMGLLVDGHWIDHRPDDAAGDGRFKRPDTVFRNWITPDGTPGPTGDGGFRAEAGRYHLYVSLACPWAHRTLIFRVLKGLETAISISVVHWLMGEQGWTFDDGPGVIPDPVGGARYLHEVYVRSDPAYTGRVTVPVLWDKHRNVTVSNESAEIIRMLNSAFDAVGAAPGDFYPVESRDVIDRFNTRIYATVNNGVYKAGFATTQAAYEEAVRPLFATLDMLEDHLATNRYLCGDRLTEADWRLFTTLVRFDAVYAGHFKCNLRRIVDFPNLWNFTRELYQQPGVAGTTNFTHIKNHYYQSHTSINPTGIVPIGPALDFRRPHGRDRVPRHGPVIRAESPSG